MYKKCHLKIRLHKRGLGLERVSIMNIRDLHQEYEGGRILKAISSAILGPKWQWIAIKHA